MLSGERLQDHWSSCLHMQKQKRSNREADQRLCFRNTARTIYLLPKFEISSLFPSSVAEQPGLCWTWSETPKTGFLMTRLDNDKTRVYRGAQFFPFFLNHRLYVIVGTVTLRRY